MTVCIAAVCDQPVEAKIVICADWQVSGTLGSAQIGYKFTELTPIWMSMFAGDPGAAREIVIALKKRFNSNEVIDETNILVVVRDVLNKRKKYLCEAFIQGRYAISYDQFVRDGKNQLPTGRFEDSIRRIEEIPLGADLIIAGFIGKIPYVVRTDQKCNAWIVDPPFATIGDGGYLAHASLLHRGHDEVTPLNATIYQVFEAKKWAERNRSVDDEMSILILHANGEHQFLEQPGIDFCKQQFESFGPKNPPLDFKFKADFLSGRPNSPS